MKNLKFLFLILIIGIFFLFGTEIVFYYFYNHSYYGNIILGEENNQRIINSIYGIENQSNTLFDFDKINFESIWMSLFGIVFGFISVSYLIRFKKPKTYIFIFLIILGLYLFGLYHGYIKGGEIGIKTIEVLGEQKNIETFIGGIYGAAPITFFIYTILISFLGIVCILGFALSGTLIYNKLLKLKTINIFDIIMSFGIGICLFLIVNYFLIFIDLFYSLTSIFIFVFYIFLIFFYFDELKNILSIIDEKLEIFYYKNILKNKIYIFYVILLILSILYYFYGFNNGFVPYPTARDANHAYMFFPKMFALNNGYYWDEEFMRTTLDIWYVYIAFFFSLLEPFKNYLSITSDTIAIQLNFLSGIFVLILGISLVDEIIEFIKKFLGKDELDDLNFKIGFSMGWLFILIWLTSGMGAFLVFVDNKMDLGVLSLIILAIYSGFNFLKKLHENGSINSINLLMKNKIIYFILLSGFFFAIAFMAKPTALLDFINFGIFLNFLWIGIIGPIGIVFIIIGALAYVQFRGIKDYISSNIGIYSSIFGGILFLIDSLKHILKKGFFYISIMLIWASSFLFFVFILKGSFVYFYKNFNNGFNFPEFVKSTLLSSSLNIEKNENNNKTNLKLIASTNKNYYLLTQIDQTSNQPISQDGATIEKQDSNQETGNSDIENTEYKQGLIGEGIQSKQLSGTEISNLIQPINTNSINQNNFNCSLDSVGIKSSDELYTGLKQIIGDSYVEDVGRYVGFGWKDFQNPWWGFIFSYGNCYGLNKDANYLCNNIDLINATKFIETQNYEELFNKKYKFYSNTNIFNLINEFEKNYKSNSQNIQEYINKLKIEFNVNKIFQLKNNLDKSGQSYKYIEDYEDFLKKVETQPDDIEVRKNDFYNQLSSQIQDNSIYVQKNCYVDNFENQEILNGCDNIILNPTNNLGNLGSFKTVFIPLKFLTVFNITFNRSLQNHSSYYTDIGFIWLILTILLLVGFVFGILTFNPILTGLCGVSILGWIIWFFIGGGILWYGIGLIVWTILANVVLIINLYSNNGIIKYLRFLVVSILGLYGIISILINFPRIDSLSGQGYYAYYKLGAGPIKKLNNSFDGNDIEVKNRFGSELMFDSQFPHYKKFIELANNREQGVGALIAGTYVRYFIDNQKNIVYDQFLEWMWKNLSDFDICKTYLRLKDKNIKYLVIDPNIGTVVQGGGNMSLFDRFYAKEDKDNGKIIQDGTISMLLKLYSAGKIKLINTNNIGTKYAFTLTNDELGKYLKNYFGKDFSDEEILYFRGKLALLRYWFSEDLLNIVGQIFVERISDGEVIYDIADIYGIQLDEINSKNKILGFIQNIIDKKIDGSNIIQFGNSLNQNEKLILSNYFSLIQMLKSSNESNAQQLKNQLTQILSKSIGAASQIIVLELK